MVFALNTVETTEDFMNTADLVVRGMVRSIEERPDTQSSDTERTPLVAMVDVADAIAGVDADVGEVEVFFTTSTEYSPTDDAPEVGEPATFVEGPDGHMFAEGDELILSLTPANETGERELTTNHSFFLVSDGELDPGLAEWRRRCAEGELRPLFAEAQELGLDDLVTRMQSIDQ